MMNIKRINENRFIQTENLNIFHQNIQSLSAKNLKLNHFIQESNLCIDVLCLTEHFMISEDDLGGALPGYEPVASYTRENYKRGGACIFVRCLSGISCVELPEVHRLTIPNEVECCAIVLPKHKLVVACVYRVPSNKITNAKKFCNTLSQILLLSNKDIRNIIITGDINIDYLKTSDICYNYECVLNSFNLNMAVKEPTRGKACLDHFVHNLETARCLGRVLDLKLSDHTAQLLKCSLFTDYVLKYWYKPKRDYNRESSNKFRAAIEKETFSEVYGATDANDALELFIKQFKYLYDECFPYIRVKMRPGRNSTSVLTNFPTDCVAEVKFSDGNVDDPQIIADRLNDLLYETKPISGSSKDSPAYDKIKVTDTSMYMAPCDPTEILNIISELDSRTEDIDGFRVECVQLVGERICAPLSHIFNLCRRQGVLPDRLKAYKCTYKFNDSNYQLSQSVSFVSNIFQILISNKIYAYLEKEHPIFKYIDKNQKMYNFDKIIKTHLDARRGVCAVFCRTSRPHRSIDHDILIQKVDALGIRGNVQGLLMSFNRKQFFEIKSFDWETKEEMRYVSKEREVTRGVPESSVLSGLLLRVYLAELCACRQLQLFGDYVALTIPDTGNFQTNINDTINSSISFLKNNKINVNLKETSIMYFGKTRDAYKIEVEYQNKSIQKTDVIKLEGLMIERQFSHKAHIQSVCKRIYKQTSLLKSARGRNQQIAAYVDNVLPLLTDGIIFWGNSKKYVDEVYRAQKHCVRAMFGLSAADSCERYLQDNDLLTVQSLYIYEIARFVKKNPDLFTRNERVTRSQRRGLLTLPNTRLVSADVSAYNMAPKIYNKLINLNESDINTLSEVDFESTLKEFLSKHYITKLEDFLYMNNT